MSQEIYIYRSIELGDDGDGRRSIDWDFLKPGRWAVYYKPHGFAPWEYERDIEEEDGKIILDKFQIKEQISLDKLQTMSPRELSSFTRVTNV